MDYSKNDKLQWTNMTAMLTLNSVLRTLTMSVSMSTIPGWPACNQLTETPWLSYVQEPSVSVTEASHFLLLSSDTLFHYTFTPSVIESFQVDWKPTCSSRPTCSDNWAHWTELGLINVAWFLIILWMASVSVMWRLPNMFSFNFLVSSGVRRLAVLWIQP